MEFDIRLDYTMDDFQAYWQAYTWKRQQQNRPEARKTPKTASPKQLTWLGVFFLAAGILTAVMMSVGMGVLEMLLGVLLMIGGWRGKHPKKSGKPSYSRWTRQVWKKHQETGPLYNCCFTDDGVWVHDSRSDHRYDYGALEALWEDESYFYLLLSTAQGACILRKDAFTKGNPEDLPSYWQSRTGKTAERVRMEPERI